MSKLITKNDLTNILNTILPSQPKDSGWRSITSYDSNFTPYSSGNNVQYRKIGNLVELQGAVKPTKTLTGSTTDLPMFTLPEHYRPPFPSYCVMQGSGNAVWYMCVKADGNVTFSRYRDGAVTTGGGFTNVTTTTWLAFTTMFFVNDTII